MKNYYFTFMDSVHKSLPIPSTASWRQVGSKQHQHCPGQWDPIAPEGFSLRERGCSILSRGWCLTGVCKVSPAKNSSQQMVTAGLCLTLENHRRNFVKGLLCDPNGFSLWEGFCCTRHNLLRVFGRTGVEWPALVQQNIGQDPGIQDTSQWF